MTATAIGKTGFWTNNQTQSCLFRVAGKGRFSEVTATRLPAMSLSVGDLEAGASIRFLGTPFAALFPWAPHLTLLGAVALRRRFAKQEGVLAG